MRQRGRSDASMAAVAKARAAWPEGKHWFLVVKRPVNPPAKGVRWKGRRSVARSGTLKGRTRPAHHLINPLIPLMQAARMTSADAFQRHGWKRRSATATAAVNQNSPGALRMGGRIEDLKRTAKVVSWRY